MSPQPELIDPALIPLSAWILGFGIMLFFFFAIAVDSILIARWPTLAPFFPRRSALVRVRPLETNDAIRVLVLLGILFMFLQAIGRQTAIISGTGSPQLPTISFVLGTLALPVFTVMSLISILSTRRVSHREAFGIRLKGFFKHIVTAVFFLTAAFPLLVVANLVYISILRSLGYQVEPQDVVRMFLESHVPLWQQVYLSFLAVVIAPITEELLFRGLCLTAALKVMPVREAVLLVSVFFAFVHQHPESAVSLFILAATLSLAYLHTGNLLVPILMHAGFNASQLIALHIVKDIPGILN